ncbi:D-3-phosphoglycerate dehydrogenase [Sedimentibacter acidaminivorans]|jgi:D-3-phosphoglycerate dehydrogenase / 2-oxoglutarate reductase|uniref:D-3-phosphoglycerate dehydrogenase n=1 Tax=Sedimentibacter acidaminivorans TaxID=913099 RepID=A0ABS4GAX2_9FIRM|nr:3-phosphoglycerate dehydrogenase family protein [Sedimentibacter acidaminivorans]MBP1924830.1 D-3-phosphoglycerate dehydrogenase [Sedimentibacter acidaminivorans]
MYKVALFNKIPKESQNMLSENKYILVNEQISEVDGIVMRSMDIHDMKFSRQLKAIARSGAGTNNIPVERCAEEGIVVFNSPGANANAVCELTFLGLLISSRKIVDSINWTKNLKQDVAVTVEKGKSQFVGPEIKGKTLGVIGLGNVGHLVANLGVKLGMEVIGYDPYISVKNALSLSWDVQYSDSLDELYKRADYITIHVPLNDETRNYIHKDNIKLMKDGVKLLNFARDGLVNDNDILEALESGKVSYFVSDLPNERLVGAKNVVCIPHLGGSTPEAENNCAEMAVSQLTEYLEHGNIRNSVNFPECTMDRYPNTKRIVVLNKNIPNMISTLTSVLAKYNINIIGMVNKSQGNFACNIIDVNGEFTEEQVREMEDFPGILRVMLIN